MPKTEYIGIRLAADVKKALKKAAEAEYRTVSGQCEMIIVEYLKQKGWLPVNKKSK